MDWLNLVLRSIEGDITAFEALVQRFQNRAVGYAYSLLGDFGLAEDAAQEAFIEAYRDLGKLRIPQAFPSWFRKIIHKCCDRLTRKKHLSLVTLDGAISIPCQRLNPEEIALRNETCHLVHDAILSLSEKERAVTTLFYIDGHSIAEISDFLAIPVTTIKKRLYDAREKLRERMVNMVEKEMKRNAPTDAFSSKVMKNLFIMEIGSELCSIYDPAPNEGILENLRNLRRKLTHDLGCMLPQMQITGNWAISPRSYRFIVKGLEVETGEVIPGYIMVKDLPLSMGQADVIKGIDPISHQPVYWINKEGFALSDIEDPRVKKAEEVLVDHLASVLMKHASDLLAEILPKGQDPNSLDEDGLTPLSIAAGCGNADLVDYLLARGAKVRTLHSAVFLGEVSEIRKILSRNPETNPKVSHPRVMPPLVLAAARGHKNIVQLLVKKGADVNIRFVDGCTPLHSAIVFGHASICKFLLMNNADPHIQTNLGENSLHMSIARNQKKIAKILLEMGADRNIPSGYGRTPLQIAEALGYGDIARVMRKFPNTGR